MLLYIQNLWIGKQLQNFNKFLQGSVPITLRTRSKCLWAASSEEARCQLDTKRDLLSPQEVFSSGQDEGE